MWKLRYRTVLAAAAIGSAAALIPLTAGSAQAQTTTGCAGPGACFHDQNWYRAGEFDNQPSYTYPDRTEHLGNLELYGNMIDIDGIRTSTGWHQLASPHC